MCIYLLITWFYFRKSRVCLFRCLQSLRIWEAKVLLWNSLQTDQTPPRVKRGTVWFWLNLKHKSTQNSHLTTQEDHLEKHKLTEEPGFRSWCISNIPSVEMIIKTWTWTFWHEVFCDFKAFHLNSNSCPVGFISVVLVKYTSNIVFDHSLSDHSQIISLSSLVWWNKMKYDNNNSVRLAVRPKDTQQPPCNALATLQNALATN